MMKEFRKFVMRGNVMDLAVGVIIGGAFATITKSLTDDLIMPVVGWIFGGFDFSRYFIRLGEIPAGYEGSLTNYSELKEAGVSLLGYGEFITVLINFLILAFIIFLFVRAVNRMEEAFAEEKPEVAAAEPTDVVLLREIRDELRAKRQPGDG
jgi:large conductance mechanosensitive channel